MADHAQLVRLLWRRVLPPQQGARGPKQKLSVDEVVATAVEIADRDGYAQVSIRSVAARLNVRPMSLYTYVPSREALTALMVDAVAEQDEPIPAGLDVRGRLLFLARAMRAEFLRHPWLLEVVRWREVGPGCSRRYEQRLVAIEGIGLSDLQMHQTIAALAALAEGSARETVAALHSQRELTDARWWQEVGPVLAKVMPAEEFPVSSRVGSTVGELYQAPGQPEAAFEFALDRFLDGLATLLSVPSVDQKQDGERSRGLPL